jgi:hypothetical protein
MWVTIRQFPADLALDPVLSPVRLFLMLVTALKEYEAYLSRIGKCRMEARLNNSRGPLRAPGLGLVLKVKVG